jgi:histidinol-phosphate aminotransferase
VIDALHAEHGGHGGPDALGAPLHDFSTNANACGPCPAALASVARADAAHYPDPSYRALRERLAAFHGVRPAQVHLAASGSEFIVRMTAAVAKLGGQGVHVPQPGYADYARAARAHGMRLVAPADAQLVWHADPASPTGQAAPIPLLAPGVVGVIDAAYAPLRLSGEAVASEGTACEGYWQLWTPNKALGLTGVRAAYALAPRAQDESLSLALDALMPSWPIGAHGVALLQSWIEPEVQQWLAGCLPLLREWKLRQLAMCESLGWRCLPGDASFFCAEPATADLQSLLLHLRAVHGIKLRDTASLGLAGHVRLNVMPPASQDALRQALLHWG